MSFVGGSVLAKEDASLRNRAQVIEKDGTYSRHDDKIHRIGLIGEDKYLDRGDKRLLFTMDGVVIGIIICYDLRFCELARVLALEGAGMLIVSAEWPTSRIYAWDALLQARAAENQMYVVGCNRCGKSDAENFGGSSMIAGPDGKIMVQAGLEEETLVAVVDTKRPKELRKAIPLFKDRVAAGQPVDFREGGEVTRMINAFASEAKAMNELYKKSQ